MHLPHLRRAIELARDSASSLAGGPFGAVIVRGEEIIAEGTNQVTTTNDPTAHAEVMAIREACRRLGTFRLSGCDLYTSCEPCPMCLGAIYWARLDRIYYAATRDDAAAAGFDDSLIYNEIPREPSTRSIPMIRSLSEEGLEPFRAWHATEGKTRY
jgi:guanine deaminase